MPWSDGLCVTDQYIYCNSPVLFQGMLVLDHSGEIKDIIHFDKKISKKDILGNMFMTKNGNNFIFVNPIEAKINIFQILQ
jgi:hypothetical protein